MVKAIEIPNPTIEIKLINFRDTATFIVYQLLRYFSLYYYFTLKVSLCATILNDKSQTVL